MSKFLVANDTKITLGEINLDEIKLTPLIDIRGCSYFDIYQRRIFAISEHGITVLCFEDAPKVIYQDSTMPVKPSHISYSHEQKMIFASNYHGGYLRIYKVGAKGIKVLTTINYGAKSKIHQALYNPENCILYVVDLGLDCIYTYDIDLDKPKLHETIKLPVGSGPRHLCFGANHTYVICEYSNEVFVIDDHLKIIAKHESLKHEFKGKAVSSAIRLSPDSKHLYVLNRGQDFITHFKVLTDGDIAFIKSYPTGGHHARDFNISPDGTQLIIVSRDTNNLTLFSVKKDGSLALVSDTKKLNHGLMIEFI